MEEEEGDDRGNNDDEDDDNDANIAERRDGIGNGSADAAASASAKGPPFSALIDVDDVFLATAAAAAAVPRRLSLDLWLD